METDVTIDFVLSQTDTRPMYLQIMEQVKGRCAIRDWSFGQKLPSIREMAAALQVSVITVKRAYLELEREGVIVTRPGKGSYVNESGAGKKIEDIEYQKLEAGVVKLVDLASDLNIEDEALISIMHKFLERKRKG